MGLADVKKAIQDRTRTEVDAIMEEGRKEADRIIAEAKEKARAQQDAFSDQTTGLLQAMERKEHAAAQFQRKTILLEEKRKALDAVFTSVRSSLDSMAASERAQILKRLASQAQEIEVKKVFCNPKDISTLKESFPAATVTADESISGGMLADDESGTVRVDYTYETLLDALREQQLAKLTGELFGDGTVATASTPTLSKENGGA